MRTFNYSPRRSVAQAAVLYAGIKPGAVLLSDGYESYNEIAQTNQLVPLECRAHARRHLIKSEEDLPKEQRGGNPLVSEFTRLISKLFAGKARSEDMSPKQRAVNQPGPMSASS